MAKARAPEFPPLAVPLDEQARERIYRAGIRALLDPEFPTKEDVLSPTLEAFSAGEAQEIARRFAQHPGWAPGTRLDDIVESCLDTWKGGDPDTFMRDLADTLAEVGVAWLTGIPEKKARPRVEKRATAPRDAKPRAAKPPAAKRAALTLEPTSDPLHDPPPPGSPPHTEWRDASALPGWRLGRQMLSAPDERPHRQRYVVLRPDGAVTAVPMPEMYALSGDLSSDGKRVLVVGMYEEAVLEFDVAGGEATKLWGDTFQAAYAGQEHVVLLHSSPDELRLMQRRGDKLKRVAHLPVPKGCRVMEWTYGGAVLVFAGKGVALVVGIHGGDIAVLGRVTYPPGDGKLSQYSDAGTRTDGRVYIQLARKVGREQRTLVYRLRGIEAAYEARFGVPPTTTA